MNTLSTWLIDPAGLTPHGFCLLWEPGLIWTHAAADATIGLSYFSIPFVLMRIASRRRDLVFKPMFWMFAAFIVLCGAGHWLDVLTLWVPAYGVQATIKVATATVSVLTALALWRLLPQVLALPSPAQMRQANDALTQLVEALRTEAKEREQAEAALRQSQKMEAVGQLTGGIAHDFNNMLAGISGGLELIRTRMAQGRSNEVERYIQIALTSANRAATLTHRLLAFSRRQTLDPKRTEMNQLVVGMKEMFSTTVGPAIEVEMRLGEALWPILSDQNELESTLLNLVINARDAMTGSGHLVIETMNCVLPDRREAPKDGIDLPPGDYVALLVIDTGIGMSSEVLAQVFEPFFTTKPLGQGTGLGLSMVCGFVQQSGGQVILRSQIGQGTTVTIYLPRDFQMAESEVEPVSEREMTAEVSTIVLVVEDEVAVRMVVVDVLEDAGYTVLEAEDGASAMDILVADTRIDLLISDVGLPGSMNGRQLADTARQRRPDLKVLFITGYSEGFVMGSGLLQEGMQVLIKPFSMAMFTTRVHGMVRGEQNIALS